MLAMPKTALVICTILLGFATARANVFTVTSTSDLGPGSLHDAILEANATPGADEIHFNIPGMGVQKIYVNTNGLPEITDPVTINGYTQPGASPNTLTVGNNAVILIQIDGQNDWLGPVNGMVISAGNSIVRGLSITGIPARVYGGIPENPPPPPPEGDAILLKTNGGNLIEGNFIGVTPAGGSAGLYHYTYTGVEVLSDDNRIGGTSPASRNVISRQYRSIVARGNGIVIEGNYLGPDPSGFAAPGNGQGVTAMGTDIRIGGTTPGAGNLISGNQIEVTVGAPARDTIIQGNFIGTTANGTGYLDGDGTQGISIYGSRTLVGGLEPRAGNRFSYGSRAVVVTGSNAVGNTILSNIFNAGYREGIIELGAGRNDLGDSDTGANNLQNFPVITSVIHSSNETRVIGGLNSVASTTFTLQFFVKRLSSTGDALLGTRNVTTDGSGMARFDFTFPGYSAVDEFISATATDADGNTSSFIPQNGRVQLANISTRGKVGTGDATLIGGLVIHRPPGFNGDYHKKLLIRALGPSLSGAGVPGCLTDSYLEVYDSTGALIAQNDNWRSHQAQEIIGSGLPPSNDLESAVVVTLRDAGYTARVRGANGETGLGIVEVFDLDPLDPINQPGSGRLVNISTRGHAGTGDDLLIGGFIVNGDAGQSVVVRAVGPDLTAVGVPDALADPTLELRDASGTLVALNNDWRDAQEQEIQQTAFAPHDNRDSAILVAFVPGHYTAIVRGKDNTSGVAIVEVFALGQ